MVQKGKETEEDTDTSKCFIVRRQFRYTCPLLNHYFQWSCPINSASNDVGSFVSRGLEGRLGRLPVLEVADKWVRIFDLVEVAKRVIDTSMTSLICSNVEDQVFHRSVAFWHVPVLLSIEKSQRTCSRLNHWFTPNGYMPLLFSHTCTAMSGMRNLGSVHFGSLPSSSSRRTLVYVWTASSST
jgi:hypothetical protein